MAHDLAEYEDRLIESAQAIIDAWNPDIDAWNPDDLENETLAPIPVGLIVNLDDALAEYTRACQEVLPGEEDAQ